VFVPTVPNQSASPFAMELGQKITTVIQEYRQSHPGLSGREVRDALRIAEMAGGGYSAARSVILAAVVAATLMGLLFAFSTGKGRGVPPGGAHGMVPFLAILLIVLTFTILRGARR